MSTQIVAQALNQSVSSTTAHGLIGGAVSLAAVIGAAWMYHHAHRVHQDTKSAGTGKAKHDPRKVVIGALLLGILMATGGGVIGELLSNGGAHVSTMLG